MAPTECRSNLGEDRSALVTRYRAAIKRALARSHFLRSLDLTVLQALVIYLTYGNYDDDGPDIYNLIGVAIGNAMRIGLHRDGAQIGLSPFQTELRRRIWGQICALDIRVAMDHQTDPTILDATFDAELPRSINDADLDPSMLRQPSAQLGKTEMVFTLVRFLANTFARRVVFSDEFCRSNGYPILTAAQKSVLTDQFKEEIEEKYLSNLNTGIPLDFVTAETARLVIAKIKLGAYKPREDSIEQLPQQEDYQKACREVLQHANTLRQYKAGRQWSWIFQTCAEWDAIAYLLLELSARPPREGDDATMTLVEDTYNHLRCDQDNIHDPRMSRIEALRAQTIEVLARQ